MNNFNILKPNKENLNIFLYLGVFFITFSFIDILSNTFFNLNITAFFPVYISYFSPLIIGFFGLHLI